MKVKKDLLLEVMEKRGLSDLALSQAMAVSIAEIDKLLNGVAVEEDTARLFIRYFGADEAARLIDWEALGKSNPFEG